MDSKTETTPQQPAPPAVASKDGLGGCERTTRTYCCSYDHEGAAWSLTIDAYDWADAEARVRKLGFLRLDGELVMTLRRGWITRAACAVRNAFA